MIKYIDIGVNLFDKRFKGKEKQIFTKSKENNIEIIITGSLLSFLRKKTLTSVSGR